jgi:hypothetical protein
VVLVVVGRMHLEVMGMIRQCHHHKEMLEDLLEMLVVVAVLEE